jgi:MoxR-like ATPase
LYQSRITDSELLERLESAGAVVIEGPKACGKTAMARQIAQREALRVNPDRLLIELELLGFLFESLVVRDLRVYAQAADA